MKMIFVKMLTVCAAWGGDQKGLVSREQSRAAAPSSLVLHLSPPEGCRGRVGCPVSSNRGGPASCGNYRNSVIFM